MNLIAEAAIDVSRYISYGEGECNAQFAIRIGTIMSYPDSHRQLDEWITHSTDLSLGQFCDKMDEVFVDAMVHLAELVDLPMVVGLAWFTANSDFGRFRTIVHMFRLWQLGKRVGISLVDIPEKVSRMITIYADFVPSAAALCIYYPLDAKNVERLKSLSLGISEALVPTVTSDVNSIKEILYHRLDDQMRTSSAATVDAMAETMRILMDATVDQIEFKGLESGVVAHSVRRAKSLHTELDRRLLFTKHTTDELSELASRAEDPCALACACLEMPKNDTVMILPLLFQRLSSTQMLKCVRVLNASNLLAIEDARLVRIVNAVRVSELDSAWLSVLNATTTQYTTGRWLDVLGRALIDDEKARSKEQGDEAVVVKHLRGENAPASTARHRLMFLDDVCKLLNDVDGDDNHRILHVTFYTADKTPISYARKINSDETRDMTRQEQHAHFAHSCYDELRMHNRRVQIPASSIKAHEGLPVDEETMRPLEVALRRKANELFKEHVDLDAVKDQLIEYDAIDEAFELVQLDDMTLPSNDLHALDPESFKVLREVALIKRQFMTKLSYREWPYKTVTGCRMRLLKCPTDTPQEATPIEPGVGTVLESIIKPH